MKNNLTVKTVPFAGTDLIAAKDEATGKIHVGVSYICKGIGMSDGQRDNEVKRIQKDLVLSKGSSNLTLPTKGGNQSAQCLDIEFLPLWLAKISITPAMRAERPDVVGILMKYQLEAKDVLANAFIYGKSANYTNYENLSPQLQLLINIETEQKLQAEAIENTNKRIDSIGEVIALDTNSWKADTKHLISKIATKLGGFDHIKDVNTEINSLVDNRGAVSLSTRLTNKRQRLADEGICKSKRDKLTKVDIIADDKKLIEIYVAIVKEMAIKYGVTLN